MQAMLSAKLEAQLKSLSLFRYRAIVINYDAATALFVSEKAYSEGARIEDILHDFPHEEQRYILFRMLVDSPGEYRNYNFVLEGLSHTVLSNKKNEPSLLSVSLINLISSPGFVIKHLYVSRKEDCTEDVLVKSLQ